MKNVFLTLVLLLLVASCNDDENTVTENATISYDPLGLDNCIYTIQTERNSFYSVHSLPKAFSKNNLAVKISYVETNERINCGFSGYLIAIKIKYIEKI